jgi:hypothetical protein
MNTFHSLMRREREPFVSRMLPDIEALNRKTAENLEGEESSVSEAIEVLVVGNHALDDEAYNAMRTAPSLRMCSTSDLRTLWLIPKQQCIHVIIFHGNLSPDQLSEAGRLARQRWPLARILVIRAGEEFLEDTLYDHRVPPSLTADVLIATIERMGLNSRKGGF